MSPLQSAEDETGTGTAGPDIVVTPEPAVEQTDEQQPGLIGRIKSIISKSQPEEKLRGAIDDFIEQSERNGDEHADGEHGQSLISNVLKLRELTVVDVMIPRADIVAIEIGTSAKDLLALLGERQYSRLPVYRETLDDVVGAIHIKDVLSCLAKGQPVSVEDLVRDMPIVSPAMAVPDLILLMKAQRKHMVFVVDEYGGIDGLATIGDVIEAIIGEVDDEHDNDDDSQIVRNADGTLTMDGRAAIEEFERACGKVLSEEEREDNDTVGGLIFALAGRVPARGEIITHPSGVVFEVLEADPRRVNRVLARNVAVAGAPSN